MKGLPFVLAFTAMTFVAWGAYGPVLHHGTDSMGRDSLRAFVGVGLAYFIIAVLVPIYILNKQGEAGKWTVTGTFYSLIAGAVGAIGALGVILALSYGGKAVYVMPLVFGFAPIVNTLVTAWLSKTFDQISPIFISGIVLAALGAGGVIYFKPTAAPHAQHDAEKERHPNSERDKDNPGERKPDSQRGDDVQSRLAPNGLQQSSTNAGPGLRSRLVPPSIQNDSAKLVLFRMPQTQDDLPPVVVQPAAPTPLPSLPATNPSVARTEAQPLAQEELPPLVVQPTPIDPAARAESANAAGLSPVTPIATPTTIPTPPAPATDKPAETAPPALATMPVAEVAVAAPETATPAATGSSSAEAAVVEASPTAKSKPPRHGLVVDLYGADVSGQRGAREKAQATVPQPNGPMIVVSIIIAAICWGSYGPMLHQGQARMAGSRLRPFTCVGISYFIIAVAAPLALIANRAADSGSWTLTGLGWSIAAGTAGALGALGVILAFNAGGKPYYVMPLVFGFAPVINTFITLTEAGTWNAVNVPFWISLAVVITGAITVLINAPKPQHKPHPAPASGNS